MMLLSDVTLRDGCHLFNHNVSVNFVESYAQFAERVGIQVLEVGHGYSIGCTSPKLNLTDSELISLVKSQVKKTRLSTHVNPDMCTVEYVKNVTRDIDIIRLACVPGEVDKLKPFLTLDKELWVSLMYTSKASRDQIVSDCKTIESFGIKTVVLFDSAGNYLPDEIGERVKLVKESSSLRVGFHGHNNLQLAVANSLAVVKAGGEIIDVSLHGIGAGAGNTPLEVMMHLTPDENLNVNEIHKYSDTLDIYPSRKTIQITNAVKNISALHVTDE